MTYYGPIKGTRRLRETVCLLLLFATPSCTRAEFPDDRWYCVDSTSQPEPIEKNGFRWIAVQTSQGHWSYVPEIVLGLKETTKWNPPGTMLTTTVNQRTWKLLRTADKCHLCAPWEQDWSICWTVGPQLHGDEWVGEPLCVLVACMVIALVIVGGVHVDLSTKRREREEQYATYIDEVTAAGEEARISKRELVREKAALRRAEREHAKLMNKTKSSQDREQARLDAERAEIAAERARSEEERERGMEAVKNAQAMLRTSPASASAQMIGKYLRDRHVQGSAFGTCVIATFLADRTGFIRLKWTVQLDRPQPPTVKIWRGKKHIHTDCSFAGEHGDSILLGRRYLYQFYVHDEEDRVCGQPAVLEVRLPIRKVWDAPQAGNQSEDLRQIREKFKNGFNVIDLITSLHSSFTDQINRRNVPEELKAMLLDQIDALATRLRDGLQ